MRKKVVVILLTLWVIGCNLSTTGSTEIKPGEEFELRCGQSASLSEAGLVVTFKDLTEDSRCPEGAVCVWAGNARVVVSLSETDVLLNTTLQPREVSHSGYRIRLVAVHPYPKLNEQYRPEDYSIKLLMTKE